MVLDNGGIGKEGDRPYFKVGAQMHVEVMVTLAARSEGDGDVKSIRVSICIHFQVTFNDKLMFIRFSCWGLGQRLWSSGLAYGWVLCTYCTSRRSLAWEASQQDQKDIEQK